MKYDGPRDKIRVLVKWQNGTYFTGYKKEQIRNGTVYYPLLTSNQDLWEIWSEFTTKRKHFFDNHSMIYYNETKEDLRWQPSYSKESFPRDYFISNYQEYPQYIIDGNNTIYLEDDSNNLGLIIGYSFAAVAVAVIIIVVIVCVVKKKKKKVQTDPGSSSSSSSTPSQQANNP